MYNVWIEIENSELDGHRDPDPVLLDSFTTEEEARAYIDAVRNEAENGTFEDDG